MNIKECVCVCVRMLRMRVYRFVEPTAYYGVLSDRFKCRGML